MILLDFFCGSGSVSSIAKELGWQTWTTDIQRFDYINVVSDILTLDVSLIPKNPDVAWFSPPCESFSIASVSHHWRKNDMGYAPKSEGAVMGLEIVHRVLEIIEVIHPKFYYIENPRGMLRKMGVMNDIPRHTVTYCQYGDNRMKPTDIWTNNSNWKPRPMCKNGDTCHQSAPRGSKTGTQGRMSYLDRSRVPSELVKEILGVSI